MLIKTVCLNLILKGFAGASMDTRHVIAYHSLIESEYEKYKKAEERIEAVILTKAEAMNKIGAALKVADQEALKILDDLDKSGFIINLGEGKIRTLHFDLACRISNIKVQYGTLRYPLETKIYIRDEEIPSFEDHAFREIKEFIPPEIYPILKHVLYKDPKKIEGLGSISGFSDFQFSAIRSILTENKKGYVLSAPTSAGKTYAFLIPSLVEVLKEKISGNDRGVKVLLVYPRKALERDQLNKMLAILYRMNYYFQEFGDKKIRLTIGIDDGDTPWKEEVDPGMSFRRAICPACGADGKEGGELKYCRTHDWVNIRCSNCGNIFDWIYSHREQIWMDKPDFLLTNVWTLDWRLPSKTIQHEHRFFEKLKLIVVDEAHVYQSLLGGNIRYLLKRLMLCTETSPKVILSSATISKPEEFAKDLLDMFKDKEFIVVKSPEIVRNKKVIYLIMAVNPQKSWETVVYELSILLGTVFFYRGFQGVIFIDSIRELYRILHQIRVAMLHYYEPKDHFDMERIQDADDPYAYWPYFYKVKMFDQYSTPLEIFGKIAIHHAKIKDREKIEKDFIDGRIGVLISTSTLELGVDYPRVNFVAIVGVPFMLESIPQRVGRAGRSLSDTLYTTLAIIILRNTPMELFYLYNPLKLVEGFKDKEIPVAWKNVAVKRYHLLSAIMDEMARNGEDTYILRTDGRAVNLDEFVTKIKEFLEKALPILQQLDSRTEKGDVLTKELTKELRQEFSRLPSKVDEWKKLHNFALVAEEAITVAYRLARRSMLLAKNTGNQELEKLAIALFKSIRRLHP